MRRYAVRRLAKNGNSLTVAIPREFLEALGLVRGVQLRVIHDDEEHALIVTRNPQRTDGLIEIAQAYDVRPLV